VRPSSGISRSGSFKASLGPHPDRSRLALALFLPPAFAIFSGCAPTALPQHSPLPSLPAQPSIPTASSTIRSTLASPTPSPTLTPSQAPTLPPQDESLFWLQAISSNMGCELPCWWGLVPGKSTWRDLEALFMSIGGRPLSPRSSPDRTRFDFVVRVVPDSDSQPAHFAVIERQGIIQGIEARFDLHQSVSSSFPPLDDAARRYSPSNLLTSAGPPTQVLISLPSGQAEEGAGWTYGIWLFYEERGLAVVYEGEGLSWQDDQLLVCPRFDGIFFIDLFLADPSADLTLEQMTAGQSAIPQQLASGELANIQDAASLTPEGFYELVQPGGCFKASPTY